jgi:hypothetical protein
MAAYQGLWADVLRDLSEAETAVTQASARAHSLAANQVPEEFREDRGMAVGSYLQGAYCSMEQALERLVRRFDGDLPTGGDSHAELLERARTPIGDLRPAIISAETADNLHELRKFRHIVRRNYGGHFDYDLAAPNVRRAEHCMAALRAELSDFAFQTGMLDVRPFGPFKGVETANLGNLNQASLFFPGHAKQYPLAIGIDLKDRKQQAEICNALRTLPTEELQERLAETRTVRDYFKPLAERSNINRQAARAAAAGHKIIAAVLRERDIEPPNGDVGGATRKRGKDIQR